MTDQVMSAMCNGDQQLGVSISQLQVASRACAHLAPGSSSGGSSQAEERLWWKGMLEFARCMRFHGVSDWPDPAPYPPCPKALRSRCPPAFNRQRR
jgi:hypothetical protein